MNVILEYLEQQKTYVPLSTRGYGIVKLVPPWDSNVEGEVVAAARPIQDKAAGDGKGNTIPIYDNWWNYIDKINPDPRAYDFWRSEGWLWINIPYKDEGKTPRAESIVSPGNYVSWDVETTTHVKLRSYLWDFNTANLDPAKDNWLEQPDIFWKATAQKNNYGPLYNVGAGIDAFCPRIALTEMWMNKNEIEIFPKGYNYKLRGVEVFDGDVPLLKMVNGQRTFPTAWHIDTPNVIPPAGWS